MKKLYFLLLPFILAACSISQNEPDMCCTIIDVGVAIKYVNENGENLLEGENALDINDITVYHKADGEWQRYFEGNLDYPKGLAIIDIENEKFLRVFVSEITDESFSETKLQFAEEDEDIIKAEVNKNESSAIVTKVWYNNELKWATTDGTERRLEVIK
jgi:hypothetical protein